MDKESRRGMRGGKRKEMRETGCEEDTGGGLQCDPSSPITETVRRRNRCVIFTNDRRHAAFNHQFERTI